MSENLDKELQDLLKDLRPLDPIPDAVDRRFEETLRALQNETRVKKRTWFNPNTFALAAGFVVVVSLGVTFTFSNENNASNSTIQNKLSQTDPSDVLVGNSFIPAEVSEEVMTSESGIDYASSPQLHEFPFIPAEQYFRIENAQKDVFECIKNLGLEEAVSLIDRGTYSGSRIIAVWSAIEKGKWQVAILSKNCQPIDQLLISK